jgi:hypothetical protein
MFESLALCFAAYKPSFGWRKSPRLRGFAIRYSAAFNSPQDESAVAAPDLKFAVNIGLAGDWPAI